MVVAEPARAELMEEARPMEPRWQRYVGVEGELAAPEHVQLVGGAKRIGARHDVALDGG